MTNAGHAALEAEIVGCRACPRLVAWREEVGRVKRRAFADQEYWAKPVPGFGDPDPWLVLVGLAPSAHGANRTGRPFTGDLSGDVLFAALHRAGLASQPASTGRDDGMRLHGCRITAAVRCAPPDNRPDDRRARPLPALPRARARAAARAPASCWRWAAWAGTPPCGRSARRGPGHASATAPRRRIGGRSLLGSYHPSPQNVSTGRLTPAMLDDVLARAAALREAPPSGG